MILIKLGGSVITHKKEYRKFNQDIVSRLCSEIKESGEKTIIVHGAGSFGHVLAKKHKINDGYLNNEQIPAVAQICYDVRELNSYIVNELNNAGIPAVSMPPGSCMMMNDRKLIMDRKELILSFLDKGIMPVLFGDVVMDKKLGFAILSGDQIMECLNQFLDIKKIIFVSDVDGLYDCDPKTNKDASLIEMVTNDTLESVSGEGEADDVTGGVVEKMRYMLRMSQGEKECVLINGNVEGRLLSTLKNEKTLCTIAKGGME